MLSLIQLRMKSSQSHTLIERSQRKKRFSHE